MINDLHDRELEAHAQGKKFEPELSLAFIGGIYGVKDFFDEFEKTGYSEADPEEV